MKAPGSRGGTALRVGVAALICVCAGSLPASPPFPLTPAQLSAASTTSPGNLHSAAVSSTGVAYTWGIGGQWLGYGMDAVALANLPTYSEANNVATRNSGNTVYGFSRVVAGSLVSAQQGIGNGLGNSVPILQVSVGVATGTGASNTYQGTTGAPTAGMYSSYAGHTLALLEDGRAIAFGRGSQGQLGVGTLTTPFLQDGLEASLDSGAVLNLNDYHVVAVAAGPTHSCFLMSTGYPRCTGSGSSSELGNGATSDLWAPAGTDISLALLAALHPDPWKTAANLRVSQVSLGYKFTCILLNSGMVSCVGKNDLKQCGQNNGGADVTTYTSLVMLPDMTGANPALQLSAGRAHACVLLADASVACWGDNTYLQIADTGASYSAARVQQLAPGYTATAVACGWHYSCIIRNDGNVVCGGGNYARNLGVATSGTPTPFSAASSTVGVGGQAVVALTGGSSAVGMCVTWRRTSAPFVSRTEVFCWGLTHMIGADDVNANDAFSSSRNMLRLTVQMSPAWDAANPQTNVTNPNTVDAGNTCVPWPVVQSVTVAPLALYAPQLPRWTYLLLRYHVAVDMSDAAALVAYMDATPCPVSQQLNDTAWICGVSPDMLLALKRAPPLFTLSWTGGPGGPGYGIYACPRPIITSALSFANLDTAVSNTITIPGFCFSTAAGPWQDVNVTNAVTLKFGPGGRLVGAVFNATTTSLVVSLPPSAGPSTVSITSNSSLLPQPLSGVPITVSYRTPVLTSFITSRGGGIVSPAGETIFIVGRYFSLPSSGTTVKVTMTFITAAVPCTHLNDTHISCVMPSFNTAATRLGVTSGSVSVTVEGSASSTVALGYQAATISYVTPLRTYTTIGTASKTFRIFGSGFGLRSTDISTVSIGGSSCTTTTWLNNTAIQCDMNAAALGRMQNGTAVVVMMGMSVAPATLANAVILSGTPAINRVSNAPGFPTSPIIIDGSALGYGTWAAGVVLGVGITSTLSGDLACASATYPGTLGTFIRCTPPAFGSLSVNTRYQVYVKLEDSITLRSPTNITFSMTPAISAVTTTRASGIVPTGETINVTCTWCSAGSVSAIQAFRLNGAVSLNYTVTRINSTTLAGSLIAAVSIPTFAGSFWNLLTVVVGGVSSNPWTLNYENATLTAISPNGYWSGGGAPARSFTLTGTNFGTGGSSIASINIGGANGGINWNANTRVYSYMASGNLASITSSRVTITMAGYNNVNGTSYPAVTDTLFTPMGLPSISRLVSKQPFDYSAPIFVSGRALGLGPPSFRYTSGGVNGAWIQRIGLYEPTSKVSLPCAANWAPPTMGDYLVCQPPAGVIPFVRYQLQVTMQNPNFTITAPTNVTFQDAPSVLVVTFITADLAATTIPSTTSVVFPTSQSIIVRARTDLNNIPSTAVSCTVLLDSSADLPADATIVPMLVGNTTASLSLTTGYAVFGNLGIVGPSDFNYTVTAQCSYTSQNVWFDATAGIRVRLLPMQVVWSTTPSNGTLMSALPSKTLPAGVLSPVSPTPALSVGARNATFRSISLVGKAPSGLSTAMATVTCTVAAAASVVDDFVQSMGTLSVSVQSNGTATFPSLGVVGSAAAQFTLLASCRWPTGEVFTSTSPLGQLAMLRAVWTTVPPTSFVYNTATNSSVLQIQRYNTTSRTWLPLVDPTVISSDVACTLAATLTGQAVPVTYLGGSVSSLQVSNATLTVAPLFLLPIYFSATGAISVDLSLSCAFRGQDMPDVTAATVMDTLNLQWKAAPPAGVMGSSTSKSIFLPALNVSLVDNRGSLQSADSTTSCDLKVDSAFDVTGTAVRAAVDGTTTVTMSKGVAAFTSWMLLAPLQSQVVLRIICTRMQGGPSVSITGNTTTFGAQVDWFNATTLNTTFPRALVIYGMSSPVYARVRVRNTTSATNASVFALAAYNSATAQPVSCDIAIAASSPAAANALLSGPPSLYQDIAPDANGYVSFALRMAATPGYAIPLALTCGFGDQAISPVTTLYVEVAAAEVRWLVRPPALFSYNTPTAAFSVAFSSVIPFNPSTGYPAFRVPLYVPTASDVACSMAATFAGADVPFSGVTALAYNTTASTMAFSGITLIPVTPGAGTNVTLATACTLRGALQMTSDNAFSAEQTLTLAWRAAPPMNFTASTSAATFDLARIQVALLDGNQQTVTSDSTTLCSLSVPSAYDPEGAPVTSSTVGGNTQVVMASGLATFTGYYVTTPVDTVITLRVTCRRKQGGADMTISAQLAGTGPTMRFYNSSTAFPSTTPLYLYDNSYNVTGRLQVRVPRTAIDTTTFSTVNYNSSLYPAASCSLSVDVTAPVAAGAYLSGDPLSYQGQRVSSTGFVVFSVRVSATPGYRIPLVMQCQYGDATITSDVLYVQVVQFSLAWETPPPLLFTYNTPTTASAVRMVVEIPADAALGRPLPTTVTPAAANLAVSDVTCVTEVYDKDAGGIVPYTGGVPQTMVAATGSIAITPFVIAPPAPPPAFNASLSVTCTFRRFLPVPAVTATSTLQLLYLDWLVLPPVSTMPSTSTESFLLPSIRLALKNATGGVLVADSTSTCSLSVLSATLVATDDLVQASIVGNAKATAAAGVVTFAAWGINAPFGSAVTVLASCSRVERGPDLMATAVVATYDVRAAWSSFSSPLSHLGPDTPTFVVDTTAAALGAVTLVVPLSTTNFTLYSLQPFNASASPASSCSLAVDTSGGVSASINGPLAQYQAVRVNDSGVATFSFRLVATPGLPLDIVMVCQIGDATITSPARSVVVAPLSMRFVRNETIAGNAFPALTTTFFYNRMLPRVSMLVQAQAVIGGNATTVVLPTTVAGTSADFACSSSATSTALGAARSITIGSAQFGPFDASNSSLTFFGAVPQPQYTAAINPVDCSIALACSFRGQGLAAISFTALMRGSYLEFASLPPPTALRSIPARGDLRWLAGFVVAFRADDGSLSDATGDCTLTASRVVSVDGADLPIRLAVLGGGVTAVMTAGSASFGPWWLDAPLSSTVTIVATCRPSDGAPPASTNTTIAMGGAQLAFVSADTLDPNATASVWFYDAPMNITAAVQSRVPRDRASAANYTIAASNQTVTCSLIVDSGSVPPGALAALGGDPGMYQGKASVDGMVRFTVRPQALPGGSIPLLVSCSLADAVLDPLPVSVRVVALAVALATPWPLTALPSTRNNVWPIASELRVTVRDEFGRLMVDDPKAKCVLTARAAAVATNGTWANLSAAASTGRPVTLLGPGASSAGQILVNGSATFTNVSVAVQMGTLVAFTVSCQRSAGGGVATTTASTAFAQALIDFDDALAPPSRVLYNSPYAVGGVLRLQPDPVNASTAVPYSPGSYGAATCSLLLDDGDAGGGLVLAGGISALTASPQPNGTMVFTLRLQRTEGSPVDTGSLVIACEAFGGQVTSRVALVTVQALVAEFVEPPAARVWPTSSSLAVVVDPMPAIHIVSTTGEAVDNTGVTCNVLVSRTTATITDGSALAQQWYARVWDPPEGGYQYDAHAGVVPLSSVKLSVWWGSVAALDVQCVRPQGDAITAASWLLRAPLVGVSWSSMPTPSIYATNALPAFNVTILDLDAPSINVNDSETVCIVTNAQGAPMRSNTATSNHGVVNFLGVQLAGRVATAYTLYVSCKYGDVPFPTTVAAAVAIQGCVAGEAPSLDATACVLCGDGAYSPGGISPCIRCPYGVQCADGILAVQEGYFVALPPDAYSNPEAYNVTILPNGRIVATITPNTELHTCWNADSCVVNVTEGSFGCAEGYTGVLCGVCDEANGWVRQANHCIPCLNPVLDLVILTFGGIAIGAALLFVSLIMDFGSPSEAKTVWRILVNYLSAIGAFGTYVAKGTETFLTSFNIFQSVLSPGSGGGLEISPVQCQVKAGFYTKFTATILLPVICASACILINVLNIARYKGPQGWRAFLDELRAFWASQKAVAVAALVLFMAYPSVTAKAFTIFQCMPSTIAGVHYLSLDLSVSCDTPTHAFAALLSWVVIGLLCGGLPALFAWWLWRNEDKVKLGVRSHFFGTFGFLYQGYKTDKPIYYVWEALVMVRKALVVSIAAVTKDPVYQCSAAILLIVFSLAGHMHVQPFARPLLNALEGLTLASLIVTLTVSLMFLRSTQVINGSLSTITPPDSASFEPPTSSRILNETTTSAVLVIVNISMCLALLFVFIATKRAELSRNATCTEQLLDCCDCGRRRARPEFLMNELTKRLADATVGVPRGVTARLSMAAKPGQRRASRVIIVDHRVVDNPLADRQWLQRNRKQRGPPPPPPRRQRRVSTVRHATRLGAQVMLQSAVNAGVSAAATVSAGSESAAVTDPDLVRHIVARRAIAARAALRGSTREKSFHMLNLLSPDADAEAARAAPRLITASGAAGTGRRLQRMQSSTVGALMARSLAPPEPLVVSPPPDLAAGAASPRPRLHRTRSSSMAALMVHTIASPQPLATGVASVATPADDHFTFDASSISGRSPIVVVTRPASNSTTTPRADAVRVNALAAYAAAGAVSRPHSRVSVAFGPTATTGYAAQRRPSIASPAAADGTFGFSNPLARR